jgi:putative flavoprotein involved in K+ transport
MAIMQGQERVNTVVIGGGQAGLSVGYHLKRHGVDFVILDDRARVGDVWRGRWDSLRLFTPARHSSLDGLPFPAPPFSFPTKDEMADYLEAYARTFALPVRSGVRVDRVSRAADGGFLVVAGDRRFHAQNVVVAMAHYQRPRVPAFARKLTPRIVQLHSLQYRNQSQLAPGDALIVGVGNSGAEIAVETAARHNTWLAGPDTGHAPFRVDGLAARLALSRLMLRVVFHRILSLATPIGRRVLPKMRHKAAPLVRLRPKDLAAAGVIRVPRVVDARDGLPMLEDGRVLDVANVVWCTGFDPGFSWIDLPVFGSDGEPRHRAGIVDQEPGLFFVGLNFLYAFSSAMIHGVGRDAARIAAVVAARESPEEEKTVRPFPVRAMA